jgi:ABC-2 type transport system ATP-binding protein
MAELSRLRINRMSVAYRRGGSPAVDSVTIVFGPGRTALLGPNGAGKSSLLAAVGGALRPRTGEVFIDPDGLRRGSRGYARQVGWMPQAVSAIPGFTVREQVAYHAWLKGHSSSTSWDLAGPAMTSAGLDELAGRKAHQLSGGQLRRVGLAQTLVSQPRVVLLDEPTAGLDPAQRSRFRGLIGSLPRELVVVVSTHLVDDLDDLFDRVVVLAAGAVRFDGTLDEFMGHSGGPGRSAAEAAYAAVVGDGEL